MKKNQNGFSVIEAFLVLIFASIVITIGWYVWSKNAQTKDSSASVSTQTSERYNKLSSTPKVDITNWKTYSSKTAQYSFKYDPDWKLLDCTKDGLSVALTPVPAYETCNKSGSDVRAGVSLADYRDLYGLVDKNCDGSRKITVTVDSVSGTRKTCTYNYRGSTPPENGFPQKTKHVDYFFYTNSKTYSFDYTELPGQTLPTKTLPEFDAMVQQTLKFSE